MEQQFLQTSQAMTTALAPVFLISGVGVLLSAMISRYGRVVDRTRTLLRDGEHLYHRAKSTGHVNKELRALYRRAKQLRAAIMLTTASISSVVVTVFVMFASILAHSSVPFVAEFFFLLGLLLLILAMLLFMNDFALSLRSIKHDMHARGDDEVFTGHGDL